MEEVFEERAAARRCAFPACENALPKCVAFSANGVARLGFSATKKSLFVRLEQVGRQVPSLLESQGDLRRPLRAAVLLAALSQGLQSASSTLRIRTKCWKKELQNDRSANLMLDLLDAMQKARVLLSRLAHKPPQLVPSLVEVFGTDKPNPLDYEDDVKPTKRVDAPAMHKPEPLPKARAVWAKTQDLGVVERKHSTANAMSVGVPPALEAATASTLKENEAPAPPDRNFPTVEQATLIEGYVFPAHKQKLAKKVEKLVKKSQEEGDDKDDIVVSDSDESDAAASDVSSADSFEISDFDDEEVVTLNDLPRFSHLWGLLSNWITHETTLLVAGLPLPAKEEEKDEADPLIQGPDKAEADAARRHARQIRVERWNSLSLMLRRPLPQVALKLKLASDRFANHRIDTITETFTLRDAIDTRNAHQV
ncbi:unnamed protein product [Phytophthora lilii]|uniref:Unnamed protein product n=1 Tax=Phytophthora lilii TaxID=2077276 RepID=A0A9W6WMV5_9STRA|nr:unnamed protein product [Phytophthora lilii]